MSLNLWFGFREIRLPQLTELADRTSLLSYLEINEGELKKIWWFHPRMYRSIKLQKKSGAFRKIFAPDERLKFLQHKIKDLLEKIYVPRKTVHGFVPARSIKTNASEHVARAFLLNLDIHNFFPSITENRVSGLFQSLSIDPECAIIIARLACRLGRLPQGAPSSPIISNMICFRMDREYHAFCKGKGLRYTRYADDLSFSTYANPKVFFLEDVPPTGRVDIEKINPEIHDIIIRNGFAINESKLRFSGYRAQKQVTGLVVNDFINVRRSKVREVRATLHCVDAKGLQEAERLLSEKYKRNTSINAHLRGKISWIGSIKGLGDPVYRRLVERYNRLFPENAIMLQPTPNEMKERSVWIIETEKAGVSDNPCCQGTAFFVKNVGLVTAFHCVEGASSIEIYHHSRQSNKFSVHLGKFCAHRDLAIIQHNIPESEYFELEKSDETPFVGQSVTALGYPDFAPGHRLSFRIGTISSIPTIRAVVCLEISAMLSQGMSGGPILCENGKVLAVAHKGGPAEYRNLAVRIKEVESIVG